MPFIEIVDVPVRNGTTRFGNVALDVNASAGDSESAERKTAEADSLAHTMAFTLAMEVIFASNRTPEGEKRDPTTESSDATITHLFRLLNLFLI